MAEGLFDNRYRYDYIYPRGRSGETLRAVDINENDRLVVIKRPAPQDAPPIRAGQEVSILAERRALQKLAGQPALTALLGSGQFNVGGVAHQYIVIERAEGYIVEDLVIELASAGERMPELEMLVVIDRLLELLEAAHTNDIVYNDVDTKHLFWNRDQYRLKVIDWGNAVFLEGEESTPQGVSRLSDVYQLGELLYFIVTGGGRVEVPRNMNATDDFRLNFSEDTERLHSRLQAIISRAVHPNPRYRYQSISELRKDLSDYRTPVERDRGAILNRITERMRRELSRDELLAQLRTLEPVRLADPGFPQVRQIEMEIESRLSDLQVSADLDAARIYLESGNWSRALTVLDELRPRARGETATLINLLLDWTTLSSETPISSAVPRAAVQEAVSLMFEDDAAEAARILVTQTEGDDRALAFQWLLAERISAHIPEIMLLRPNLYRLQVALAELSHDGLPVGEPRALLNEINASLDQLTGSTSNTVIELRDGFRLVVEQLKTLEQMLEVSNSSYHLPNKLLPITALTRAINAAMALADNMHVIGKQAISSPREALGAVDHSRQIVPAAPAWDAVAHELDGLYQVLSGMETYIPAADGLDIFEWLQGAHADLEPFNAGLFDESLAGMVDRLGQAQLHWEQYEVAVVHGRKGDCVVLLQSMEESLRRIAPALASWLGQLRSVVRNTGYVERNALFGALGRALADGWENFDRGRLPDAERLGIQAAEAARTESERAAAQRLRELSRHMREWVERGGITDLRRTQETLTAVELLYSPDEIGLRDNFAAQMPSKEIYLKSMSKGLAEPLTELGTAPVRIFFANVVLYGALDARENRMDDAMFWHDAAARVLGDSGARHTVVRVLEEYMQQRRDLEDAQTLISTVNSSSVLQNLEKTRRSLEENAQSKLMSPAVHSLREVEAAVRDWADGEFRAAGNKLENAVKSVDEIEQSAQITLTPYRAWLMNLLMVSAELHSNARKLAQMVERLPAHPTDELLQAHLFLEETTVRVLGEQYAVTLRQWREMYEMFSGVFADRSLRRSSKLNRLNDFFRAMFIDRHPAYPLYQHWYALTEQTPEFPAPPTSEPIPRISEADDFVETPALASESLPPLYARSRRRSSRWIVMIGLLGGIALIAAALALSNNQPGGVDIPLTRTIEIAATDGQIALVGTPEITAEITFEHTPTGEATAAPTRLPTGIGLNLTSIPVLATIGERQTETVAPTRTPSQTPTTSNTPSPTSSATFTATNTYTPTLTPSPTLPPGGLRGTQDLLALSAEQRLFDENIFSQNFEDETWRLGSGSSQGGGTLTIAPSASVLNETFGGDASSRILQMEAALVLQSYNPPLLLDGDVFYGVLLRSADDPDQAVGVQIDLTSSEIMRISQYANGITTPISQRAIPNVPLRIRLTRNLNDNTVSVFINDQPLGQAIPFVDRDTPVEPMLFVHDGGVILYVNDWDINLR
ncbi:MAG: hypothetical protein IAE89_06075 [Anaerolineae bacterium]|nr:hypothetical protein [Anaerolineae bacterium]